MEDLIELLKSINNGKVKGAKLKLAKHLNVSSASVSQWISHKTEPSADNIEKMAKFFKVPTTTIQKIFLENSNINSYNKINNSFNSTLNKEIELKNKEIELLKKEIELKNKEIELLKK